MRRTLVVMTLLAALAAGCGNQPAGTGVASVSKAPTSSPAAGTTADPQEQARKWAQCMREHGVSVEDPDPNGNGINVIGSKTDKSKIQKAMEACSKEAPFKDRSALAPVDTDQLREFAKCMRDNGVDMPDPEPGKGLAGILSGSRDVKVGDPRFKKAFEACNKKLPKTGAAK